MSRYLQNSYVQNWYGHGGSVMAMGAVDPDDFIAVRAAQANELKKFYGQTDIDRPGLVGVGYPRMSGAYAVKLIDYWRGEASRFSSPSFNGVMTLIMGGSAVLEKWLRDVGNLDTGVGAALRAKAIGLGPQQLSDSDTKTLWDTLDKVIIPMGAIKQTPSHWEFMKESVAESIADLAKTGPFKALGGLLNAAKWIGGGLIAYVVYDAIRSK